jgi:hypothetical protein
MLMAVADKGQSRWTTIARSSLALTIALTALAACAPPHEDTAVIHLAEKPAPAAPSADPQTEPEPEKAAARPPKTTPDFDQPTHESGDLDDRSRARQLFMDGVEAYSQGNYAKARDRFQEAYDLVPEQPLLFNLASAELRMGEVVAACGHFRDYVSRGDPADPRVQQVQSQVTQRCKSIP